MLGACLLSRDAMANVLELVGAEDFYKPANTEIFNAMLELYGKGEPIDSVTLVEELRRRSTIDSVGGKPYIFTLVQTVPTAGSAIHYARIVEEHALLRRLIEASHEISGLAFSVPEDVEQVVDFSENLIYNVSQRREAQDFTALKDLLTENMEMVEKLYERGSSITGLPTGFTELDNITAGLQPSNLIIIAARPAQGKSALALSMAQHVAVEEQIPAVIFSLEMSKMELVQRLMCSEARVDSNRLRRGALTDSDWPKLSHALGRLAEAPIFIDDTASITIMEMRAKCRRLKAKHGLGLIIVDYLQLMQPPMGRRSDNRVQEVADISRSLKILARELDLPVIAVSQLSRNVEHRTDKRPMLADLRDSGCLTADTKVLRADTGATVSMGELFLRDERNVPVWTIDNDLKMTVGTMTHVFASGVKQVYRLRLRSGREVQASANHPFLTFDGWRRLDELSVGDRIATPRLIPEPVAVRPWPDEKIILLAHLIGDGCFVRRQPLHYTNADPLNLDAVANAAKFFGVTSRRVKQKNWWHEYLPAPYHLTHGKRNPICEWLDQLGLYGKRSREKFIPEEVFRLPNHQAALFVRHLWATDGHLSYVPNNGVVLYYGSGSRRLIDDLQTLLLRLGIPSLVRTMPKKGYKPTFGLHVTAAANQIRFLETIGVHGERGLKAPALIARLKGLRSNPSLDTVPARVWNSVQEKMEEKGITHSQFEEAMGTDYYGNTSYQPSVSREKLGRVATLLEDEALQTLAESDLFWDSIAGIDPLGEEPVFDATVLGTHNFVANGIVVENSIEQDSDIVMFIYRDELYNSDSPSKGIAEIHIAKHRNGPVGKVELAFLDHYTKFANLAKGI